jgi:hypothetical protein
MMSKSRLIPLAVLVTVVTAWATTGDLCWADPEQEGPPPGVSAEAQKVLPFYDELDDLLLVPEPYYYESMGRRDLFVSLVSRDSREIETGGIPSSDELVVVGILWAENDRFALAEAADGTSMILREGSRVGDGTVLQVLPDRIVIHVTAFGTSHDVTLPLVQGGSFHESPHSRSR